LIPDYSSSSVDASKRLTMMKKSARRKANPLGSRRQGKDFRHKNGRGASLHFSGTSSFRNAFSNASIRAISLSDPVLIPLKAMAATRKVAPTNTLKVLPMSE
jgi:hypothetical protein